VRARYGIRYYTLCAKFKYISYEWFVFSGDDLRRGEKEKKIRNCAARLDARAENARLWKIRILMMEFFLFFFPFSLRNVIIRPKKVRTRQLEIGGSRFSKTFVHSLRRRDFFISRQRIEIQFVNVWRSETSSETRVCEVRRRIENAKNAKTV